MERVRIWLPTPTPRLASPRGRRHLRRILHRTAEQRLKGAPCPVLWPVCRPLDARHRPEPRKIRVLEKTRERPAPREHSPRERPRQAALQGAPPCRGIRAGVQRGLSVIRSRHHRRTLPRVRMEAQDPDPCRPHGRARHSGTRVAGRAGTALAGRARWGAHPPPLPISRYISAATDFGPRPLGCAPAAPLPPPARGGLAAPPSG